MKKILKVLLVVVMSLTLTACGNKKITITKDNWQNYFEIKQEFVMDESNQEVYHFTMLCLNEQYADKVVDNETDLSISYSATESYYKYSIVDGKIIKGKKTTYAPRSEVYTFKHRDYAAINDKLDEKLEKEFNKIALFQSTSIDDAVGIFDTLEITEVIGTLVLK